MPSLNATPVRLPFQIVSPCVIDAAEIFFVGAVIVEANESAAMRAAVFEGVDLAVGIVRDNHWSIADETSAKVTWLRYLGFQAEVCAGPCLCGEEC